MKQRLSIALLTGSSVLACAAAHAQTASTARAEDSLEEVVVTGSRVITNGNNSPTPVTVLSAEEFLKLQPTTITEAVNLLPALQGSQNVTSRPGGAQRNGAGAYMNLRNMGSLRTLVLFDGIRVVPTINQNGGDVDSSAVPGLLLKRVDVVTGGVSAVYGSDAVSGVINYITDREFNGFKAQASYGQSTYSDNEIFDVGFAAGMKFADNRGNVSFSYQFHDDPGITNRGDTDREFFSRVPGAGGNGTTVPYFNMLDMRISNTSFGGLITNVAGNATLRDLVFTPSGTLRPFQHGLIPTVNRLVPFGTAGATAVPTNTESGGDGAYFRSASLKAGIKFHQAFSRVDYDLTDNLHAFAQLAYSTVDTFNNFRSPNFTNVRISYSNPFLASVQAPYNATLAANPTGVLTFARLLDNDNHAEQFTDTHMAHAGLEGTLGEYKWNFSLGNSRSEIDAVNNVNIDNGKLFASVDAVTSGGQIVCRASQTNANYAGCVPLNLFGEGRTSQTALNYLYTKTNAVYTTNLDTVNVGITGTLFDAWAGPVNAALSAEWRRLRWDVTSNASPEQLADCVGIGTGVNNDLRNCTQGTTARWFFNTGGPLNEVSQRVAEVAGEFNLPLLADAAFAQGLDFIGAVRFTDYSTSGNVTTWKAGLDWRVNDSLKFRSTRSRDIRAPNLHDLYQPTQRNPTIQINDPLQGGAAYIITNVQTGNTALTPETANTLTAGFVLTPQAVPDFSLSMDYYKIRVDDVIFLLQGFSNPVLQLCATTPSAPACAYIQRDPVTGRVVQTRSLLLNIAKQDTWGIDTEASYKFDVFSRPLQLRAMASYQPKLDFDQGPLTGGKLTVAGAYNAGTNRLFASPKWKVTGIISYEATDKFNVTVLQRWRSGLDANQDRSLRFANSRLPSISYTTLNLSYSQDTSKGNFNVFLNVQNLFNKFPTAYYTGTQGFGDNQGLPEGDDPIGRYYTLGVRWKM